MCLNISKLFRADTAEAARGSGRQVTVQAGAISYTGETVHTWSSLKTVFSVWKRLRQ
jgi:hypothetical protein